MSILPYLSGLKESEINEKIFSDFSYSDYANK